MSKYNPVPYDEVDDDYFDPDGVNHFSSYDAAIEAAELEGLDPDGVEITRLGMYTYNEALIQHKNGIPCVQSDRFNPNERNYFQSYFDAKAAAMLSGLDPSCVLQEVVAGRGATGWYRYKNK